MSGIIIKVEADPVETAYVAEMSSTREVVPQRCGVRFDPPAIILLYSVKPSGKLHRRTMPLRNFTRNSGVSRIAEELKSSSRHKQYLEKVPLSQLDKLVSVIRDKMNGMSLEASLARNDDIHHIDPEEDLNKVDEETLKRKKAIMEESFAKHSKKIGDADFQYDIEVDFDQGGPIESCDWDSDGDFDGF